MALGKSLDEAEKISKEDVAKALDGLPPQKMECSNLSADTLRIGILKYKKERGIKGGSDLNDQINELKLDQNKFDNPHP